MARNEDPARRREVAALVEQRRREIGTRADVSQRLRDLSASGSHMPRPNVKSPKRPLVTYLAVGTAGFLVLVLVALLVVILAGRVWFQNQVSSPGDIAQAYFAALHQQDFQRAYGYFAPAEQAKLSESAFAAQEQSFEQIDGIIETYTITATKAGGNAATVTMQVTRQASDQPHTETLYFSQQNGTWYITSVVIATGPR